MSKSKWRTSGRVGDGRIYSGRCSHSNNSLEMQARYDSVKKDARNVVKAVFDKSMERDRERKRGQYEEKVDKRDPSWKVNKKKQRRLSSPLKASQSQPHPQETIFFLVAVSRGFAVRMIRHSTFTQRHLSESVTTLICFLKY